MASLWEYVKRAFSTTYDAVKVIGVAGATAVPVTVSGTVTTTGGLTDTQLRATAVPVSVASVPSHAVTNAGTFAVQNTDTWRVALISSETENDSDVTFTVPANKEWQILSVWVELVTTATVGDRKIAVEVQDNSSDVLYKVTAGAVQAAGVSRFYAFAPGMPDLVAFRDTNYLTTPIPNIILPTTYILRVYDAGGVDTAADDMVVQILYAARTV